MEEGGCIRGGYRMMVIGCDEQVAPDPEPGDYVTAAQAQQIASASSSQALQQAEDYSDTTLATHEAQTVDVHGIADTADLLTQAAVDGLATEADLSAHETATTGVHGIADTSQLLTQASIDSLATRQELTDHEADTTAVHGIPDTSQLVTQTDLTGLASDADLSAHTSATTSVHGIADTSVLETVTGSQAKANTAQTNAINTAASALSTHSSDTTDVHGITDTALLVTSADLDGYATDADLSTHAADTTAVHGITDTAVLETQSGAQAKATAAQDAAASSLATHAADTTNIHGIADTAALITQTGGDGRYLLQTARGAANGVASLGADSKVPTTQLRLFTLNAKDYGALGNAAAEDATPIQAALNAARDADGGWVVVPPGTYLLGATLRIYDSTRLTLLPGVEFRRNHTGTMILNGDAGQAFGGWTGNGNITIEGGLWNMRGTTAGLTGSAMCISIGHARNVTVRDLEVRDLPGFHAIELNSTKIALVENCRFRGYVDPGSRDFSEAIQLDLAKSADVFGGFGPYDNTVCEDIEIRGCYFGASGTAGTTAWPRGVGSHSATVDTTHRRIRIIDNTFEGMLQYGVVPYAYDDCVISENTMVNCGCGVRARTIIAADAADTTNTSGVQTNASQVMKNLVITNNTIRGTGGADDGILLYGEPSGRIVGATIGDNVVDTVSGSENGIRIFYADQYTVSGNTVRGVGGTGISQEQVIGGVITGNRVFQVSGGSGISCESGANMKISDNTIRDVGVNGVHILGGTDITVTDNDISGASRAAHLTSYGIRASTSCDGLRMVGNKVRLYGSGNESAYGAGITSTCTNVTRFGNDLRGDIGPLDDQSSLPLTTPWDTYDPLGEVMRPAGRWETRPRLRVSTGNSPTSGTLTLVPLWLPRGVTLSQLAFSSTGTAAVTPTNYWFILLSNTRVGLARTADQTTAAWASNTTKALAIAQTTAGAATSYTTTYAGLHYLGVMIAAGTVPTLASEGVVANLHTTDPGFGPTTTAMTTAPTVTGGAFTAAAFGGSQAQLLYGYAT